MTSSAATGILGWSHLPNPSIGQGAGECPSRFRHRADGYLPPAKAEVRFVYALQHWLPLLEFSVIRDRDPIRIFGKDRPSQIKFLGRAAGSKREAYQRCR